MNKIYFATENKAKVKSLSNILSNHGIEVCHVQLELPEPRSDDLREIAKQKVLFAYEHIKKPCVALDVGFYIPSLNGFPRAFVNFAIETIGIAGILKLNEGKKRDCEFRNCLAYLDPRISEPVYFESRVKGQLSETPCGKLRDYHWSKLSSIFVPNNARKTLAEMTFGEYQHWRMQAHKNSFATKFAEWFTQRT